MNNASDMIKDVKPLFVIFKQQYLDVYHEKEGFLIRCPAHVINLAVIDCVGEVHKRINKT